MSRTRSRSSVADSVSCTLSQMAVGETDPQHPFVLVDYPSGYIHTTYVPGSTTEVMLDTVTPNFNRLRNSGQIVNNYCQKTTTEIKRNPCDTYWSLFAFTMSHGVPIVYTGWRYSGSLAPTNPWWDLESGFPATPTLDVEALKSQAITGAHSKVSVGEVQGLVILAEGEKTIKSLIDLTKRFVRIGRALRKWDTRYLSKQFTAKELSDRWMEGRYAIRPVIYDLIDVINALKKERSIDKMIRQTFRSGASDTTINQSVGTVGGYYPYFTLNGTFFTKRTVNVRSGVLTAIDEISDAMIWGLDQPFQALWELVPFSFVVDWFFNVGKTIAAWSPKFGIKQLASWVTVVDTVMSGNYVTGATNTYSASNLWEHEISVSSGFVTKTTTTKTRFPNPSQPILPTFNVRLDAAKLIDLAIWGKRFFR